MSLAPMPTAVPNELDLRHYIHVLWRRRRTFLQMFLLVLALGLTSVVLQRPVFRTSARLMAPSSSIGAQIAINDGSSPIASLLGEVMPEELDAQVERLRSTPFREAVQKRAGPRARGVSLRVEGEMDSATITITAQGTDPEGCARAANAAAALHQERSRERQTAGLRNTLEFLQKQVAEAEGALQDADRRLQTASLARNADRPGREEAATRRSELRREVAAREQSVRAAEARRDAVRRRQAAPGVPSDSSLRVDRPVDERISILLRQRAALLEFYTPENYRVQEVDAQIAAAREEVAQSTSSGAGPVDQRASSELDCRLEELELELEGERAALEQARARLAQVPAVPTAEVLDPEVNRLTVERNSAEENYRTLRSHLRALRIREQIPPLVTQVLEEARVPSEPVSQGRAQYLVAFAVMAAALGLGAALLQDHLDDRIRTPDDVERASQLVSLGHVPFLDPTESGIVLDGSARSPVAEAYRALRASVDFAAMEGQVRRLLVTSPNKSEGKSVTSVNLAAAMAFNGKRVVLVDADLRRPSLHRVFGLSQERGLSQVLAGQLEVSEALQTTSRENLWVLTSGPLPHNPAELLGSPRLDQLLDCLAGIADFVILDSPPCLPVADPLVVASRVDAVLLVVHAGHTRRPALRHVRQLLQRAHARLLGVVMNRVEPGRRGDYYYSSYYYGYGYETESRGPTRGPGCGRMPFDSPSPTAEFGPGRERVGETTDGPTQSAA